MPNLLCSFTDFTAQSMGQAKQALTFPPNHPFLLPGRDCNQAFAACNFTITAALNAAISGRNGGTGLDGRLMGFVGK